MNDCTVLQVPALNSQPKLASETAPRAHESIYLIRYTQDSSSASPIFYAQAFCCIVVLRFLCGQNGIPVLQWTVPVNRKDLRQLSSSQEQSRYSSILLTGLTFVRRAKIDVQSYPPMVSSLTGNRRFMLGLVYSYSWYVWALWLHTKLKVILYASTGGVAPVSDDVKLDKITIFPEWKSYYHTRYRKEQRPQGHTEILLLLLPYRANECSLDCSSCPLNATINTAEYYSTV